MLKESPLSCEVPHLYHVRVRLVFRAYVHVEHGTGRPLRAPAFYSDSHVTWLIASRIAMMARASRLSFQGPHLSRV